MQWPVVIGLGCGGAHAMLAWQLFSVLQGVLLCVDTAHKSGLASTGWLKRVCLRCISLGAAIEQVPIQI